MERPLKVLLVVKDPARSHELESLLGRGGRGRIELLPAGPESVAPVWTAGPADLAVVDIDGFEEQEFAINIRACIRDAEVPVITLGSAEDEAFAGKVLRAGAQDYLVKKRLHAEMLLRVFRYAIERTRAEKLARGSAVGLRTIVTHNADAIIVMDEKGVVRYVNPAAEALFRVKADVFIGSCFGHPVLGAETAEIDIVRRDGPCVAEMRTVRIEWEGKPAMLATLRDITERKRMEQALRTSEDRFRKLVESTTDYIYSVTVREGKAVESEHGPGCIAVTGFTSEDYRADPYLWYRMIHNEDRNAVVGHAESVLAGKAGPPLEHRLFRKDGGVVWVKNALVPHYDQAGRLQSYDGMITDITERKKFELALAESENRFRQLVESSPAIVYVYCVGTGGVYYSPRVEQVLGYSPEYLYEHPLVWHDSIHAEDRERVEQAIGEFAQNRSFEVEYRVRDAAGTWHWLYDRSIGGGADERGLIIEGMALDITERKTAEEKVLAHSRDLGKIAESAVTLSTLPLTENIYETICDTLMRIFDISMTWLGMAEGAGGIMPVAQSGSGEVDRRTIEFIWNESYKDQRPAAAAERTGKPQLMNDLQAETGGGRWRDDALRIGYRSAVALPLANAGGKVIGVVSLYSCEPLAFSRDKMELLQIFTAHAEGVIERRLLIENLEKTVSERTRELRESMLHAESATRAKSDFLANMSHELRTPLNSVLGFSEVLMDKLYGPLSEKQDDYVKNIFHSGKHLLSLINDILDLSKVESGKLTLELSRVRMAHIMKNSVVMVREKAMKHGISLDVEMSPDADIEVETDERKLKQVLYNLLSNAVKFTPDKGSVRVMARRVRSETSGSGSEASGVRGEEFGVRSAAQDVSPLTPNPLPDFLEISVADTGIGIKAADMGKLFKPFSQLEGAYTKTYEGTGLGLALSKRLVEFLGGRIWVKSEFGKGCMFAFTLPVKTPSAMRDMNDREKMDDEQQEAWP